MKVALFAIIASVMDYVLHLDVYLTELVCKLGDWTYVVIAATIFCETGLVVTPFLPGESLLMTSGAVAGTGILDIAILAPTLFAAAFCGDLCNYSIGRAIGHRLLKKPRRYLKPEHVAKAHEFYERHGGLAIVLGRFMPVVRTLAPFVAGMARMEIHRLMFFAAVASALWVAIFLGAGYWFGTVAWVKEYLAFVLLGIVILCMLPGFIVYLVRRFRGKRADGESGE